MSINAMKQALEALDVASSCLDGYYIPLGKSTLPEIEEAITSLRQAIAEQDGDCQQCGGKGCVACDARKQEPVACLVETEQAVMLWPIEDIAEAETYCDTEEFPTLLYTHPPKREWVGLTDEDYFQEDGTEEFEEGAMWAEAKLKERNT